MMDTTGGKWIIVGRFGRPHGVKGLISVHSFTEPRENLLKYSDWHAKINNQWKRLNILHAEVNNKTILAKVEGLDDRDGASKLTNIELAVTKDNLPELAQGEYYWYQLVGMRVVNHKGVLLGTVNEMIPTGANDVLVTQGHKKHLIPYVPEKVILQIDEQNNVITVDWEEDY